MTLFKTLKLGPTNILKMGGIQSHSVKGQKTDKLEANVSPVDMGINKLTQLGVSTSGGALQKNKKPSISNMMKNLIGNKQFVAPGFSSNFNSILPSYLLHFNYNNLRNTSSDELNVSTREFSPYERLTGISQSRPEILMLTQFLPLFEKNGSQNSHSYIDRLKNSGVHPSMTDAGWYADTQINARNVRAVTVLRSISALRAQNLVVKASIVTRKQDLGTHLNSLNSSVDFLLQLVRKSDLLKAKLDLRDEIHTTQPQQQVQMHALKFTEIRLNWSSNSLKTVSSRFLPLKYDVPDTLVRLGYKRKNADEIFSSTKLWLQMLMEFKHIVQNHSLEFLDIEPSIQKLDDNAVSLTRSDVKYFNIKQKDSPGLLSVKNIAATAVDAVKATISTTSRAFSFIYEEGATFKSEEARIAALANILSREFNFSTGLSISQVKRSLTDFFAYTPSDFGNVEMFDNIIGQFGTNVSEIPSIQTNSLANLAQQQPTVNVAVLPFESKYLEGDNGTLTPGSTYYVDQAFKTSGQNFDTARLEQFSSQLKKAHASFNVIISGLNLLQVSSMDASNKKQNTFANVLSDPTSLIELQLKDFVDEKGRTRPLIRDDRLTSVYSMAQSSTDIKAILFVYIMTRITRSYNKTPFGFQGTLVQDNTPLTDALIARLLDLIAAETKKSPAITKQIASTRSPSSQSDANDLDAASITSAMKTGTGLTRVIESFMAKILSSFESKNAFNNDRTRYSGHIDTIVMMVAFDIVVSMINRYGNQQIVGRQQESRKAVNPKEGLNYIISHATVNFKSATNDLVNRLNREQSLIHQLAWSVTNTLSSLHGAIDEFTNYLKSPPALASLRSISSVVDNPSEFQALLSQQQIMMLGSTVHDIIGRFKRINTQNSFDLNKDGNFDSDDELKILDDSLISPNIKNAFYGLFNNDEFTDSKANNKRILTVGIPLGFTQKLQQKISTKALKSSSFANKQSDIVNITVYKIDMLNQDIVYKPCKFMVELSRFPVRDDGHFRIIPDNPTISDLADAIPTRDYEESFEEGTSSVAYWRSGNDGDHNTRLALDANSYDFLTQEEKAEIIKNHLMSYILEVYIKLMTGLSVAEHTFDIDPGDIPIRPVELPFIKVLTEFKVQQVANFASFNRPGLQLLNLSPGGKQQMPRPLTRPVGGTLFRPTCRQRLPSVGSKFRHNLLNQPRVTNLAGLAGKVALTHQFKAITSSPIKKRLTNFNSTANTLTANMNLISRRHIPKLLVDLNSLAFFSRMQTTLADGLQVSKQLLRPKQFDRVFNVIVDPDEFEIDYDKTMETQHGKIAFEMLMKQGDLIPSTITPVERRIQHQLPMKFQSKNIGRLSSDPNVNNFRFRDRDKNQGDLMFEKYFITIETYDEEAV